MEQVVLSPITLDQLIDSIRQTVREEIKAEASKEQEKLLSPAEACKLFQPAITKPTLESWSEAGYLHKHKIGKRVFYKYSEVIAGVTTLQRYKTKTAISAN